MTAIIEEVEKEDLVVYSDTKQELELFVADYTNTIVVDKTLPDAKKARQILREKRYSIQNAEKQNNSIINDLKKMNKEEAASLIQIIKPVEDRIDTDIKKIEEQKQKEKEERERVNIERIKKLTDKLSSFRSESAAFIASCTSYDKIEELNLKMDEWSKIDITTFEEFTDQIQIAIDIAVEDSINKITELKEDYQVKLNEAIAKHESVLGFTPDNLVLESILKSISDEEIRLKTEAEQKAKEEQEQLAKQKAEQAQKDKDLKERERKLKAKEDAQLKKEQAEKDAQDKKDRDKAEAERILNESRNNYQKHFNKVAEETLTANELNDLIADDIRNEEIKADKTHQLKFAKDKKIFTKYLNQFKSDNDDSSLTNEESKILFQEFKSELIQLADKYKLKLNRL